MPINNSKNSNSTNISIRAKIQNEIRSEVKRGSFNKTRIMEMLLSESNKLNENEIVQIECEIVGAFSRARELGFMCE